MDVGIQPHRWSLGVPALGDEDVDRLDVAVDDPSELAASSASAISIARPTKTSVSKGSNVWGRQLLPTSSPLPFFAALSSGHVHRMDLDTVT